MPNETETAMAPGPPPGMAPAAPQGRGGKRRRLRAAACATAAALLLAAAGSGRAAQTRILHLRCTNPASGASWPLVVDFDHRRVDSLAATVSGNSVSWRDPQRGFFDLDTATGKLELRNASATGGYFLYYTCRPQ
jgi:hypothetical protein